MFQLITSCIVEPRKQFLQRYFNFFVQQGVQVTLPGPVKGKPSTPGLGDSQEFSLQRTSPKGLPSFSLTLFNVDILHTQNCPYNNPISPWPAMAEYNLE